MRSKTTNNRAQRDLATAFQSPSKRATSTEYEIQQQAFRNNYQRLKAERLAREAAKSKEK
jgi:hypothetical protein